MATTKAGARKGAIKRMVNNRTVEFYVETLNEADKAKFQSDFNDILNADKAEGLESLIDDVYAKLDSFEPTKEQKKLINEAKKANKAKPAIEVEDEGDYTLIVSKLKNLSYTDLETIENKIKALIASKKEAYKNELERQKAEIEAKIKELL